MLPIKARLLVKDHRGKGVNLWLPLFLLWPVLLVLLILCFPFILLAELVRICGVDEIPKMFSLLSAIYGFLAALRGLTVDVEDEENKVKIIIN